MNTQSISPILPLVSWVQDLPTRGRPPKAEEFEQAAHELHVAPEQAVGVYLAQQAKNEGYFAPFAEFSLKDAFGVAANLAIPGMGIRLDSFGELIENAQKECNLNNKELADRTKVDPVSILHYKAEAHFPPYNTFRSSPLAEFIHLHCGVSPMESLALRNANEIVKRYNTEPVALKRGAIEILTGKPKVKVGQTRWAYFLTNFVRTFNEKRVDKINFSRLGRILNVSRAVVSSYRTGVRMPNPDNFFLLRKRLEAARLWDAVEEATTAFIVTEIQKKYSEEPEGLNRAMRLISNTRLTAAITNNPFGEVLMRISITQDHEEALIEKLGINRVSLRAYKLGLRFPSTAIFSRMIPCLRDDYRVPPLQVTGAFLASKARKITGLPEMKAALQFAGQVVDEL